MLNLRTMTWAALSSLVLAAPATADKTAGQTIDDSTIATETKAALIDKDKVSAGSLNVEVNKGTVQLAGFVDSEVEKAAALKTAQQIKGVVKVLDAMVVLPGHRTAGQTLDDSTMQASLKTKLAQQGEGAGRRDRQGHQGREAGAQLHRSGALIPRCPFRAGRWPRVGKLAGPVSGGGPACSVQRAVADPRRIVASGRSSSW